MHLAKIEGWVIFENRKMTRGNSRWRDTLSRGRGEHRACGQQLYFWAEPGVPGGREKERKTGELCMVFSTAAFHIKVIHIF